VVTDAEVLFGYAVTLMAGLLGITAPVTVDGDPEGDLADELVAAAQP
jgi:hypothetical protein